MIILKSYVEWKLALFEVNCQYKIRRRLSRIEVITIWPINPFTALILAR
jgi:hypothetical protein